MEIKKMLVDPQLEQSGVWVDYDETTKFLLGSLNSPRYRKIYREALEKARNIRQSRMTDEQSDAINIEVMAKAVLLDWQGVHMDGNDYPPTDEHKIYVLKNCPQIREFVVARATNFELFKREATEEAKAELGEG
jgi:hypothetical protein